MGTLRANGIDIYFEVHGAGEPLVLLEGIGADHSTWLPHLPELTRHFRCLLFDNRGMGKTDQPDGKYTSRVFADDTAALMQATGFTRAHVVGLSMGACIAQELCLGYPEKVRSMILVSGWARPDAYLKELFGLWICLAENLNLDATWMDALLWSFSHRMYNERLEEIEALKKGVGEADMSVGSFVRQARACISHDATDRLHGVKAPTLILVGAEDIFTPYRLARDLHRAIPKSTLKVLDDQAHAFPIENPQVLIQEIRDFVLTQRADK